MKRNCILPPGDNLPYLKEMPSESVALIYIDPPFNTGKTQSRQRVRVLQDKNGTRTGFGGKQYRTEVVGESGYDDSFADFSAFLRPRLQEAHRILAANGSLFFHIDWRESARCRLLLEEIFGGAAHCINEIIWAYDFGGRGKNKWPPKHDNIYWFAKNPADYIYNYDAVDRIPYMAPGLAGKEKAMRGKTPTNVWWNKVAPIDVWWNTIVPTNGHEKTGYATQKPLAIVDRIVRVHSNVGDLVVDFFAGSGTTGEAAIKNGRDYILIDKNPEAVRVMKQRIGSLGKNMQHEITHSRPYAENNIFLQLARIADDLGLGYPQQKAEWEGSPFEWIVHFLSSSEKGAVGKQLVRNLLAQHEFTVSKTTSKNSDMTVNGHTVAVKFSTLWKNEVYTFQQIRNQDYDILLCLGISPKNAHAWVARTSDIAWNTIAHQHGGKRGKDDWWVSVAPPTSSHAWMRPQNGNLFGMIMELRRITDAGK